VVIADLTRAEISRIQNVIWDCTEPDIEVSQEDWEWLQSL